MRVLVTGGAGFIGSHLVDLLVGDGHEVAVLDNASPHAHATRPEAGLNPRARYHWADVRDPAAWDAAIEALGGIDAVSHQAAMVGLGVNFGDVLDYVTTNDAGTAAGLLALHRRDFRGRFVLASSMVVYGEGAYRCPDHGPVRPAPRAEADLVAGHFEPPCPHCGQPLVAEPVTEDTPPDPRNVYAATKLHQEHLSFTYAREHDSAAVALRYHNVYGPRMPRDTPYAGVASIFRSALEAGRDPRVFEDGRQLRDFIHVRDVARANRLALTAPLEGSIACNVATGVRHSIADMASELCRAFGRPAPAPVQPWRYRLGDVRHVFGSPDLARQTLGFRAEVSFEDGMAEFAHAPLRAAPPATA
ncbi:MAG: SDR family NAD(P)-dependent oxidoreductase [Dehalococcoidia bacterium]|nr:SDR family NAD(P)-dependent oxidoreductase [Dehalococcoidia bacterium]